MAVVTFNAFDFLPVMTFCAGFLKCLSVIFPRGVAIRTFHSIAGHMGFMRKFYVVEGDGTFFYAHMAKGCTGHPGLKFSGGMTFINNGQGLLRLIVRRIDQFKGILNIVNPLAKKDKAVVVASLIEQILGFLETGRASVGFFIIVEDFLNIEDPLVGIILSPGEKHFPVF
jgi:hypothetical protein